MLPNTNLGQRGPPGIRKLRGGNPHSRRHLRSRHEVSPFLAMRSHAISVNKMHSRVGSLVTQDLFQKLRRTVDEPGSQGDFRATRAVAPEGPLES